DSLSALKIHLRRGQFTMNGTNLAVLRDGVRPVDQMKSTYTFQDGGNAVLDDAHNLFKARGAFTNFGSKTLDRLTELLRTALAECPDDPQVLYELAFARLQNRCDHRGLLEADLLNNTALDILQNGSIQQKTDIPANLKQKALRLRTIINMT